MSKEKLTGKERFNELRYQMEKNSFVLSVIESRTAAVLHAESMGYDDTSTAMICRINAEYVKLIKAVKDQHPGSIEDIAQELYDRIYMQTGWKRDYSRFQLFDEELIERWFIVKEQERQLRAGNIDMDDLIGNIKHAYYTKTGKDVDIIVKEIEEKPEQLEQEPESEPEIEETPEQAQARVDMGKAMREWVADERREERLETLFELVQDGTLSAGNAFEYIPSDYGFDFDEFLRLQEAWEEERTDG